ncbi:general secretion pathway protein GspB [Ketobacter sp.]|uniref:general secretion pathway protein GspB n=1 Tax=Ketobacter sp. TaxID=2083498 RepID=UPI000F275FCF|nr:general secretion pathway protein GspB [Ketobacter sp.]RLT97432.1 MAG: hypothetical protein D9N14_11675 [Ketobacter sp.]
MSYILDALRKSEQERQRGKVPDIHGAVSDAPNAKARANVWPIITVAVIALNVGILGYFWLRIPPGNAPADTVAGTPPPASNPPSVPAPSLVQPLVPSTAHTPPTAARPASSAGVAPAMNPSPAEVPPSAAPVQTARTAPPPTFTNTPQPEQEQAPLPKVGYLPQLEELPPYEREGIPDMTFSSHMYSSLPRFRSIIINGKRLKEGQYLSEDLQVREITEGGVIMSFGNTLFEVDVLGRWAQ